MNKVKISLAEEKFHCIKFDNSVNREIKKQITTNIKINDRHGLMECALIQLV